jgi:hypothetical protein
VARGLVQGAAQVSRLVEGVGIDKQEPTAPRLARRGPNGIDLAGPARLQLGGLQHGDSGKAARDLRGPVGGAVVDHDQLPVAAQFEDVVRLVDQRLQAGVDAVFLIPGRNDHRQFQERLRLRLVVHRAGAHGPLRPLARVVRKPKHWLEGARSLCQGGLGGVFTHGGLPLHSCPFVSVL